MNVVMMVTGVLRFVRILMGHTPAAAHLAIISTVMLIPAMVYDFNMI